MPAAILAFRLRLRRISQNVLNVAMATPPGILLILLVSLKNPKFRFRYIYEIGSITVDNAQSPSLKPRREWYPETSLDKHR